MLTINRIAKMFFSGTIIIFFLLTSVLTETNSQTILPTEHLNTNEQSDIIKLNSNSHKELNHFHQITLNKEGDNGNHLLSQNNFLSNDSNAQMNYFFKSNTKMVLVSDILEVFNIERLSQRWNNVSTELSKNCSISMEDYINGLKLGKLWALKVDDASGHYTSGFFYGNSYWMGSLSLCESIYKPKHDFEQKPQKQGKNGISHGQEYYNLKTNKHENPPFKPGFYVLKIKVNETMMAQLVRTIHVGVCLPSTCDIEDVKILATVSQFELPQRELTILDVRSPTLNPYNMWTD